MKKVDVKIKYRDQEIKEYKQSVVERAKNNKEVIKIISGQKITPESFGEAALIVDEFITALDTCKKCTSLSECNMPVNGMMNSIKVVSGKIIPTITPCKYKSITLKMSHLNNYVERYFGSKLLEAKIEDINTKMPSKASIVKEFSEILIAKCKGRKMLYVHGSPGVGKTFLMAAFSNRMVEKGYKVASVFVPSYVSDLKNLSKDPGAWKEKSDSVKRADILILDDIGGEKIDSWGRDEILLPLINYRLENGLPTFFTSNYSMRELFNKYKTNKATIEATRIMDRIKALAMEMEIIGDSKR